MNRYIYQNMMQGLIATIKEKICVHGYEDAEREINSILTLIEDLETFWNNDGSYGEFNYTLEAEKIFTE